MRFFVRRLLGSLFTLLLATFVFHTAISLLPGDPIRALFGPAQPDPAVYAGLAAQYHFDAPWYLRYLLYLGDLLRGDLGHSFPGAARNRIYQGPAVTSVLAGAIPVSLRILLGTLAIQVVVGLAAGAVAARRQGWGPRAVYAVALVLVAVPVIVIAFVLQSVVGWELKWLPVTGMSAGWRSYVLPILSLSAATTAYVVLITRSELMETLEAPFIRYGRARSLPEWRIVGVHGLRASLVPVVTVIAANFGQLLTGLVIVEGVFAQAGVGGALFRALQTRDPGLLVGLLLFTTALVLVANLIADLLHVVIDPRVSLTRD